MWESTVDGRVLHFHLAAINNQNFIMADEETGSWWQQVTGVAIMGPLRGRRLRAVSSELTSWQQFRDEHSSGRVLRPDPNAQAHYYPSGFESVIARMPAVTPVRASDRLAPRTMVAGIVTHDVAKAYAMVDLRAQSPVVDDLDDQPVLVVLGPDGSTVRAFDRHLDGRVASFFARADGSAWRLVDDLSGSEWDFSGHALRGAMAGKQLRRIDVLVEYWFDWQVYHPSSRVYTAGSRAR